MFVMSVCPHLASGPGAKHAVLMSTAQGNAIVLNVAQHPPSILYQLEEKKLFRDGTKQHALHPGETQLQGMQQSESAAQNQALVRDV